MKLLKVLVAALVMTAMVTPVIAEDRLSLNGEMRVRGWHESLDIKQIKDQGTDTWADQRLRIGGKIAVAEGVSITFRTDITESTWGTGNTFGSGRIGLQQWDRAHIDLVKGNFHVRAGQQYVAYGQTYAVDAQNNGVAVDYKFGDVPFNTFVLLYDDNATAATAAVPEYVIDMDPASPTFGDPILNVDEDGDALGAAAVAASASTDQADAFLFGAKVSPKLGDVATNFFVAGDNDGSEVVYLVGADMKAMFGSVNLKGEIDYFFGKINKDVDAMGLNILLDGSMAVSDATTVGLQGFYGQGTDDVAEEQVTYLGNRFGGYDPVMDVGTSLSNEQITFGSPFNLGELNAFEQPGFTAESLGSIGARLYTNFKANDDLSLGASIGYFAQAEDTFYDAEVIALAGGLVYNLMENTTLQLQLQYTDGELEDNVNKGDKLEFDNFSAGTGVYVKF